MGGCYLCPVCYALHFLFAFLHSPHSGTYAEAINCSLATTEYDKYTPEVAQEVQVFLSLSFIKASSHALPTTAYCYCSPVVQDGREVWEESDRKKDEQKKW